MCVHTMEYYSSLTRKEILTYITTWKKLEDKILELEGISPEYFQSVVSISIFKKK